MPTIDELRIKHPEIRDDFTIDQHWQRYGADEHGTWKTLFERQMTVLPGRACDEFLAGVSKLGLVPGEIPEFERASDALEKLTGWRVVAVPSLVPDEIFFEHLANRRFPVGQFIRRADQLDYIEEPDVFHDFFGHVPMLAHPVFADYMEAYGKGGLRALSRIQCAEEPGAALLVHGGVRPDRNEAGLRIFGSGIVSSRAESIYSVESPSPNRIGFDLERVMRTDYRIDDFQESYFVIDSLRGADGGNLQGFRRHLSPAADGPDLQARRRAGNRPRAHPRHPQLCRRVPRGGVSGAMG